MTKIRVLHVDDSAIIRGIISRILKSDPDIELVGSAINGLNGVEMYNQHKPDIVIMDIEMPEMDGITSLTEILKGDKMAKVVMCSTLTTKNADIALRAMRLGAIDYVAKPTNAGEVGSSDEFRDNLLRMVKNIIPVAKDGEKEKPKLYQNEVTFRPEPPLHWKPKVIAIGSSTGGPQALMNFLKELKGIDLPVVITQHMPETFTTLMARNVSTHTGFECIEAEDDTPLKSGSAILARGGKHMKFVKNTFGEAVVKLDDGEPENFCKPSVDVMQRSLVEHFGGNVLSVILTGMGNDGQVGTQAIVDAGGYCVAQDEETSVVWGMPGAVATTGLSSATLPLSHIAQWIKDHI